MACDPSPQRGWRVVPTTAWTRATDGTTVVMDMTSGIPLHLSATGSLVWDVLVADRSPEVALDEPPLTLLHEKDVVAEVAAAFDELPGTVETGVVAFLDQLADRGILERVSPTSVRRDGTDEGRP